MRLVSFVVITCTGLLAAVALAGMAGARINTTKSIPVGLYWKSSDQIRKGGYVIFCPPQSSIFLEAKKRGYINGGYCPGGYGYMMKKVLAAKNDIVDVSANGVSVNGVLLPLSKVKKTDPAGRTLPRYQLNQYVLGDTDVLLMSDISEISFDSRYFGPISTKQIKSVILPIFTWN